MSAFPRKVVVLPLVSALSLLLAACSTTAADQGSSSEETTSIDSELALSQRAAVFTLSNEAQNAVLAFKRGLDGSITPAGRTPTSGVGTGGGLGSQGALAITPNGHWLVAVNAGSHDVSVFSVSGTSLRLASVTPSGGQMPISVATRSGLVYVLNAGGSGNVAGFRLDGYGRLKPISGATRPLSTSASGPAQVAITHDLRNVVVTEKATSSVVTYAVYEDGSLGGAAVTASSGQTPFGFALTSDGTLVVSEAVGAAAGAGTVSSYRVGNSSMPSLRSSSVRTNQTAPCWVAITGDDAYAYSANTPSGTVSGFSIDTAGGLTVLPGDGRAAVTGEGSRPTDLAVSRGAPFLYVLEAGAHAITVFQVRGDGSLVPAQVPCAEDLPASTVGLVVI
jgi:6-phosphogluconolactonase